MPEIEDFSKVPKSITEEKANRASSGRVWTPRDVLISALRDLDSGEIKPVDLAITYVQLNEDGAYVTGQYLSYKCGLRIIGAAQKLLRWVSRDDND